MAQPPVELLQVGAEWPLWATKDFVELCLQRVAGSAGFRLAEWKSSSAVTATFGFMCDRNLHREDETRWCSFRVLARHTKKSRMEEKAFTLESCLEHNHPVASNYQFKLEARQYAKQAAERIVQAATAEIRQIKAREGFRIGYEKEDVDLTFVWPDQQRAVIEDVRKHVGESAARALFWEVRKTGLLVRGYPDISTALPLPPRPPSRSQSPLSSAHSSIASPSSDESSSDSSSSEDERVHVPSASQPRPPTSAVRADQVAFEPSRHEQYAAQPAVPRNKRSRSPSPSHEQWKLAIRKSAGQYANNPQFFTNERHLPAHRQGTESASRLSSSAPSDVPPVSLDYPSLSTDCPPLSLGYPAPSTVESYLRPRPSPTSTSAFSTELAPFLASLFPYKHPTELESISSTLLLAGLSSIDEVFLLLLMEKGSLVGFNEVVQQWGGTSDACRELANFFRTMREAAGKDGLPVQA